MGKWTQLRSKFPGAPLDGDYQLKVEAIKQDYLKTGVLASDSTLKDQYVQLRHSKDKLKAALAQVDAELKACEQLFIEKFQARDVQNQKFEDGLTLYLRDDPTFKLGDSASFYDWVKSNPDHQSEFPLTVHPATLQARLKDRLEAGDELPPGTEVGYIKTDLGARGLPKE